MRQRKAKAISPNRVTIGYVRVSTDDQAENGASLDAQEARLKAYSAAMMWDGLELVRDAGASAKSLQRPGMTPLLERVRRGEIERIVATKLDRLTRSTRDLADLLDLCAKHDVALVSVSESLDTSSAGGRMITNMMGAVAQWEREIIGERTADGLRNLRARREAYGPTPFGYRREGTRIVPDEREQAAFAHAVRRDREGASFREIARELTAMGVMPHRSATWHASSVRAVLRSRIALEAA